jgi:16S rRNA (cytosine967-C5)-methyltransferase
VNAVLRSISRTAGLPPDSSESLPCAAHPAWLVDRWTSFYGLDAARAICRHGQQQPQLSLRLQSPAVEAELQKEGVQLEAGSLLEAARTVLSGDVTSTEAFQRGRTRIQDEASHLIGELAANLLQNRNKILDACAAPGGKTLILAERNPDAHIVALEASPKRLADLRQRLAAHADHVECRLADASAIGEESVFDVVLADVPCSGTGTLGRNPEIRHRLRLEDLDRHAGNQRAILRAALRAVRPGGQVVYSTCSLEPEENEQVLEQVPAETPNARQVSLASQIGSLLESKILTAAGAEHLRGCLSPEGALRLLPGQLPTDGFFVALIEKNV